MLRGKVACSGGLQRAANATRRCEVFCHTQNVKVRNEDERRKRLFIETAIPPTTVGATGHGIELSIAPPPVTMMT